VCVVVGENLEDRPVIRVSAVVLRDAEGRVLTVRKRGTASFMLPGGKPEPGESARQAATRELAEELSLEVDVNRLRELGSFVAPAANEDDSVVQADVFEAPPGGDSRPSAEIEELRWQSPDPASFPPDLAPLLADHVLPALGRRSLGSLALSAGSASGTDSSHAYAMVDEAPR
jgi:8-oxo-dGTP diphosphatase